MVTAHKIPIMGGKANVMVDPILKNPEVDQEWQSLCWYVSVRIRAEATQTVPALWRERGIRLG